MPKSVLRYLLDKVRYFDLEIYLNPILFYSNEEAVRQGRVKQFIMHLGNLMCAKLHTNMFLLLSKLFGAYSIIQIYHYLQVYTSL